MRVILTVFFMAIKLAGMTQGGQLPKPTNLSGTLVKNSDGYYIDLKWDKRMEGDTLTESYFLFNNFPPGEKLYMNGKINRISDHSYSYKISYPYAAKYYFAVRAYAYFPLDYKSEVSDTIMVMVPSVRVPTPIIQEAVLSGNEILISWNYDQILDLKTFQLFVNDKEISLEQGIRSYRHDVSTDESSDFVVRLKAVTDSGLNSDWSPKVFVKK